MPTPQHIREVLEHATNNWTAVAAGWHVATAIVVLAILGGWRPSNRLAGAVLPLPLLSVSVISALQASPFNAAVPGAVALALILLSFRLNREPARFAGGWPAVIGALLLAFGLVYPHFLNVDSPIAYVYAAPTGVIPCPTLALLTGAALLADGLRSRAYALTIASAGLSYGVFGALVLHVWIDLTLVAGASLLLLVAWRGRWRPAEGDAVTASRCGPTAPSPPPGAETR